MIKKIIYLTLTIFIVIQFFRIDQTNPPVTKAMEFVTVNNTPNGIKNILQNTCYDCHSSETIYPWYASVQPVGWWINNHIKEARHELNFSEWGTYPDKKKEKKIEECLEMIRGKEMPPAYYSLMHPVAKLNESQHKLLMEYFSNLQNSTGTLTEPEQEYE